MRQTGEMLRSTARGQSEAFDRANKGFDYYICGVEVLENTPTGARGNFDRDFADAVVKVDPTKFRLVPPSQYHTSDSEPRPVDGPDAGQYRLSRRAQ